jgi:hypothetical protein
MNIEPVRRVLDSIGARYALIGGHAVAARGYPRSTVDIDLLTTELKVLDPDPWSELERAGAAVERRRGDDEDPLAGVVHVLLADGTDIDVVVGRWKWEARIIERAEVMTVSPDVEIAVPQTSDLILLKLAAGGFLDLRDAAALLAAGDRDALVGEVEGRLADVRPDVSAVWRDVLSAVGN